MQIVCNTCVGARVYQHLGEQFSTPFMWNVIPFTSFLNLCSKIRKINFKSGRFFLHYKRRFVVVEVDGIQLRFVHHMEGSTDVPIKGTGTKSIDVKCKNIISKYFKDVFYRRVDRMDTSRGFVFILDSIATYSGHPHITDEQILDFLGVGVGPFDKKILLTTDEKFTRYGNSDTLVIVSETGNTYQNGGLIVNNGIFKSWCQLSSLG